MPGETLPFTPPEYCSHRGRNDSMRDGGSTTQALKGVDGREEAK